MKTIDLEIGFKVDVRNPCHRETTFSFHLIRCVTTIALAVHPIALDIGFDFCFDFVSTQCNFPLDLTMNAVRRVVLVCVGCFNPVTHKHLRLMGKYIRTLPSMLIHISAQAPFSSPLFQRL